MDGGLPPGAVLDEFDILKPLARGGFSIVYRARHRATDAEAALKEYFPAKVAGYRAGLHAFVNEARILAGLSHANVIPLQRCWRANGTVYFAMPLVAGPTLRQLRQSMKEAPNEAWLRALFAPLLDALAALHAQGIYHRDIAPDNVLLSGGGEPVLIDFGAAWQAGVAAQRPLSAVARHGHAPIEHYAGGSHADIGPWTDLYALGALVAYLLIGETPPRAPQRAALDRWTLPGVRGMSPMLLSAVRWALAVHPHERPRNVEEFRRALQLPRPTAQQDHRLFVPLDETTQRRLQARATGPLDCHVAALLATRSMAANPRILATPRTGQ